MYGDASWFELAGRLLIVSFFVVAGLFNLTGERRRDHKDLAVVQLVPAAVVRPSRQLVVRHATMSRGHARHSTSS